MYFLFRHKNNVHGNKKLKKFQCEFCPFSTHARDYLYEHRSDFSLKLTDSLDPNLYYESDTVLWSFVTTKQIHKMTTIFTQNGSEWKKNQNCSVLSKSQAKVIIVSVWLRNIILVKLGWIFLF